MAKNTTFLLRSIVSSSANVWSLPILCSLFRDTEVDFAKVFEKLKRNSVCTELPINNQQTDSKVTHRGIELLPSSAYVSDYTAHCLHCLDRLTIFIVPLCKKTYNWIGCPHFQDHRWKDIGRENPNMLCLFLCD